MVHTDISDTSSSLAMVGGYIVFVGIFSYIIKDRYFMSEALLAFLAGIAFGPIGANIFNPLDWVQGDHHSLNYMTFQFSRIIIGIQVFLTGAALPKKYMKTEWLSLCTLLFPVMTAAWFASALLIWGLILGLTYLEALIIGSCVTPTDPVLANSICKGSFAEKYVPKSVRNMLLAEAAANDGLGFPFLFMALYLMLIKEPSHSRHTIGAAVGAWFHDILLYQILLSCVLGAIIGYLGRKALTYAHEKRWMDHEAFLTYGLALVLLTLGWVGTIGSDDLLCCFAMGCSINWDDFYRVKNEEDGFQDAVDALLNTGIFIFIGAVMPWSQFGNFWGITPWRLVVLGICIMLLRRIPAVIALSKFIPALSGWNEAIFAGYFGPIGVGAVFYTQVSLERIPDEGSRERLLNVCLPVVYFLVMTSIVVHGITIPFGVAVYRGWNLLRGKKSGDESAPGSREMTLTASMPVHKTMTIHPPHDPPTPSTMDVHHWPGENVHASGLTTPCAHEHGSGIELVISKEMHDTDAMSIGAASHATHVTNPQKKYIDSMV